MTTQRGLTVDIFRWDHGDCTNDGVTSRARGLRSILLVGAGITGPVELREGAPALKLVQRTIRGIGTYYHAEPLDPPPAGAAGWMHGGNFVYTSDGRLSEAGVTYPIAVHDRCEKGGK